MPRVAYSGSEELIEVYRGIHRYIVAYTEVYRGTQRYPELYSELSLAIRGL